MATEKNPDLREVIYHSLLPAIVPPLGKVVRKADVPGHDMARITGNPVDQGTDWAMIGPWINGAAEFSAGVFTLEPQQTHPPHFHPTGPEFYYIVSGSCLVQVDDETIEATPETAIYLPEGTVHAVWTRADETVTILYAFAERAEEPVTTVWLEEREEQED